jgi:Uma2 family endonuclease
MGMVYSESMSYTATDDPPRHRYTVADYHRMDEAGIFAPDARVELIDGEIIDMAPIGSPHVSTVLEPDHLLKDAVRGQALVLVQAPIVLDDYSAPQPDLALLKLRADYYRSSLPRAADVLLIIEVAQSSQRYDRSVKVPLYARHDIPEVWLIDAASRKLIRHRAPFQGAYASVDTPDLTKPLAIEQLPDARLNLGGALAPNAI